MFAQAAGTNRLNGLGAAHLAKAGTRLLKN